MFGRAWSEAEGTVFPSCTVFSIGEFVSGAASAS